MNSVFQGLRPTAPAAVLGLVLTGTAACTADEPAPEPRPSVDRNTIAAAELGEQLTITARVVLRLDDRSFVVQDADLPIGGLLVVARTAVDVRPPILVTVRGTVHTFRYDTHAADGLGPRSSYATFESQRAVIADGVTVWAGSAPSSFSGTAV